MAYHIIGYQTNPITGETLFNILCDTVADLPTSPVSDNGYGGEIGQGSKAVVIADGSSYLADSNRQWIYQPNPNAWVNVYTKSEIDEMITEIYEIIAYYHTTLVSDTGEITFYAFDGYIGTWKIFGNGQQQGTPSPQNIVPFDGTGERTGNLIDERTASYADSTHVNINKSAPIMLTANQAYTFSCNTVCNGLYFRSAADDSTLKNGNNTATLTYTPATDTAVYVRIWNSGGVTGLQPMLVSGSTAPTSHIPYGWQIPLTCAGQTVPVYLGQVQTVRRIRKLVLTGEENWNEGTSDYYILINVSGRGEGVPNSTALSTHTENGVVVNNNGTALFFKKSVFVHTSVADFKSFLQQQYAAGHPVTVWYILNEPETAISNEPLAKIGDYADELSSTDAGVTIPTVKGQNTLTVDTILKPSRIEIQG